MYDTYIINKLYNIQNDREFLSFFFSFYNLLSSLIYNLIHFAYYDL